MAIISTYAFWTCPVEEIFRRKEGAIEISHKNERMAGIRWVRFNY